jgi:Pentapeptide repeats (8 copies)
MKQQIQDELERRVSNSSEKNRNFFTSTLVIFVYLSIVVVQTSDLDLLIGRNIQLPLININMPMFAFYISAPLLVLALHFNLIQNIESHFAKLCDWRNSHPNQKVIRSSLYPFIFDNAILDEASVFIGLTKLVNQIVIFWSGPLTILLILWRFTDYQSLGVTFWHFICLCANLWLVSRCRRVIFSSDHNKSTLKTSTFKSILMHSLLIFSWHVRNINKNTFSNFIGISIWCCATLQLVLLVIIYISTFHPVEIQRFKMPEFMFARINVEPNENLLALDEKNLRFQYELDDRDFSDLYLEKLIESNNKLTPYKYSFYEWFIIKGFGLNLKNRSLKFSRLKFADLRRADLTNANLIGSDLHGALLQGADLSFAKIESAHLDFTKLQRASLKDIKIDDLTSFYNCETSSDTYLGTLDNNEYYPVLSPPTEAFMNKMRQQGWPK